MLKKEGITELGCWGLPTAPAISTAPMWLVVRLGRLKLAVPLEADGALNAKITGGDLVSSLFPSSFSLSDTRNKDVKFSIGLSFFKEAWPKVHHLIRRSVFSLHFCP